MSHEITIAFWAGWFCNLLLFIFIYMFTGRKKR